jgi:hypothetical protein
VRGTTLRKTLIVGAMVPGSLFLLYIEWYFIAMRDDLKYFFVFKHALNSGPDYAPSIIVGLSIMSFVALWLIVVIVTTSAWAVKRRGRETAGL